MFQLAADYERKANLAAALETSLRTQYDQNAPLPEIFEAFLTPFKDQCPLLAQSRHEVLHRTCPLLRVKQTWLFAEVRFRGRYRG